MAELSDRIDRAVAHIIETGRDNVDPDRLSDFACRACMGDLAEPQQEYESEPAAPEMSQPVNDYGQEQHGLDSPSM